MRFFSAAVITLSVHFSTNAYADATPIMENYEACVSFKVKEVMDTMQETGHCMTDLRTKISALFRARDNCSSSDSKLVQETALNKLKECEKKYKVAEQQLKKLFPVLEIAKSQKKCGNQLITNLQLFRGNLEVEYKNYNTAARGLSECSRR